MKSELLKLTPFYVSQIIYWYVDYIPVNQPLFENNLHTAFIKCLPVSTLALYLLTSGLPNAQVKSLFLGMVWSIGGDFCLVFPEYFIPGILCFAVAQICFISAFGFRPLKPFYALIIGVSMTYVLSLILPNIKEAPIKFGFPIYSALLGTMVWRALARLDQGLVEFLTACGAVIFMISDACIGINLFYYKLSHSQEIIMSTYYLAQFLIALSGAKWISNHEKTE